MVFGYYPTAYGIVSISIRAKSTPGSPAPSFQCLKVVGAEQGQSKSQKKVQTAIKIIPQLIFSRSAISLTLPSV